MILDSNQENLSETVIDSYHSSAPVQSESKISTSDDQATAADVDVSMNDWHSRSSTSSKQFLHKQRKYRHFNCAQTIPTNIKESERSFEIENDRVYQHLNNIDMTMIRDRTRLLTSETPKHFSICILPRFDSDVVQQSNNHTKVLSHKRQYAFKKEILYH